MVGNWLKEQKYFCPDNLLLIDLVAAKKILFITTHNLATNPRIFKEIKLAIKHGFDVEVVCFEFDNWSYHYNKELLKELKATAKIHTIQAGRKPFWPWFISTGKEWLYRKIGLLSSISNSFLSLAVSRRSDQLIRVLKKIEYTDLVIAHNPGALWPAIWFSKRINCKAGFDVEDYHPGETNDIYLKKMTENLLKRFLPQMDYLSFASSLIKNEIEKLIPDTNSNCLTVLNYFSAGEFIQPTEPNTGIVKFVWFSQHIGFNRGLEKIIPVFNQMEGKAEFHLFGHVNDDFYRQYLGEAKNIILHKPLPQVELHQELLRFDIGLAIEPGRDLNNQLAVSNKLLAYLQAGLFVIATDTPAQKDLLDQYPGNGIGFNIKQNKFKEIAGQIISEIDDIRNDRLNRYLRNRDLSWENESNRLLHQWNQLTNAG